ncbi:hypothetical protein [Neoroseomonas rubea]|uniref:hypothetical protein n=1 Tax=Neoroseomonas rubea TaxID=2748666 RepID=UPI0018DFDE5A|nr:hypothetical protein [Roseomonas rubea]
MSQPVHPALAPLPRYVKPSQFPATFNLSDEFAYRRLAAGDFRGVKAGRATLIETASVLDYLARNPLRLSRKAPVQKDRAA